MQYHVQMSQIEVNQRQIAQQRQLENVLQLPEQTL